MFLKHNFVTFYAISVLLLIFSLEFGEAWNKSYFYIDSTLPRECGHSKAFSPENYFEYWGFWPWLGMAYFYLGGDTPFKSNVVLIHPQVVVSGLDFFKYDPKLILEDSLFVVFSLPGLPSFQNISVTHIDFTGSSYNTGSSVAMLRLSKPVIISANVQPICLWDEDHDYFKQLKSHYAIVVGAELEDLLSISNLRIYQAPVRITPPENCHYEQRFDYNKTEIKSLCYSYYRTPIYCHGSGSTLILPRITETGSIVWYLRSIVVQRIWYCEKYRNNPWSFDLASVRPWIESHFRPSIEKRCGRKTDSHTPLVTFGNETKRGDWPWHAALFMDNIDKTNKTYRCGGSLISESYVVTAAHCVYSESDLLTDRLSVKLGKLNLAKHEKDSKNRKVSEIIPHELYNTETLRNDIALLLLAKKVIYNKYIQPICLWYGEDLDKKNVFNRIGGVPGWGLNENNQYPDNLYISTIPIVDDLYCYQSHATFYNNFLTNSTLCAGNPRGNGSGVCNGDSGGGLVLPITQDDQEATWYLRGIVSVTVRRNNRNICDLDYYAIYTDVAKYLDWIKFQTTLFDSETPTGSST